MQQLRNYATVLKPLLGSDPSATTEVVLEAVVSMAPLLGYINRSTELD
jgi:hypothetical protein